MWLICRIVDSRSGQQVCPEKFQECDESYTFGNIFHTLELPPTLGSVTPKGFFLSSTGRPSDFWTASDLNHPVSLASQFKKPYVKFTVNIIAPNASGGSMNIVDRLMAGSRRLAQLERESHLPQLPEPKESSSPGFTQKDALKNYIIENVLKKNGLYFRDKHQMETDGVLMLRVLTDALWNIDEHHEKINHRATFSADVSSIPDIFFSCRGFNDNRKKKHAVRLERKTVENLSFKY